MSSPRLRGGSLSLLPLVGWLLALPAAAADLPVYGDAVVFPRADGSSETRLYLQAGPVAWTPGDSLSAEGGDLLVGFRLEGKGTEAEEWRRVYAWEGSGSAPRLWRLDLVRELAPGDWDGELTVESLRGGERGESTFRVRVPEPGDGDGVSGLLFGTCGDGAGEASVIPHPSRVYVTGEDVACILLRVEDSEGEPLRVTFSVRDAGGATREEGTIELDPGERDLVLHPRLDDLPRGRYRLRVNVPRAGRSIRREGEFEVQGGASLIPEDPLEVRTILSYVATGQELAELDRIDTADLPAFWERFWSVRDRNRGTAANEAEAEFLARVEYAIRYLGDMRPGWDTDRGEMYIRYGEPDKMETVPGGGGRLPTWIWYYYDRNLTLVFQDVDGSGRYRLAANRRR